MYDYKEKLSNDGQKFHQIIIRYFLYLMPTQVVRHTCSGNLGIVKILHCTTQTKIHPKNVFWQEDGPP